MPDRPFAAGVLQGCGSVTKNRGPCPECEARRQWLAKRICRACGGPSDGEAPHCPNCDPAALRMLLDVVGKDLAAANARAEEAERKLAQLRQGFDDACRGAGLLDAESEVAWNDDPVPSPARVAALEEFWRAWQGAQEEKREYFRAIRVQGDFSQQRVRERAVREAQERFDAAADRLAALEAQGDA